MPRCLCCESWWRPAGLAEGGSHMAEIPRSFDLRDLDAILPRLVDRGLPGGGEFLCADLINDERTASIIVLLIWHGFLPMAGHDDTGLGMLLPKMHESRCILVPAEIHIGKKVRRRAGGFRLTVNADWWAVVRSVQQFTFTTHEGDCWLSDELAGAYLSGSKSKWQRGGIAFHSVELWDAASGQLVAGEIGYTCGSMYSSCTGFALKDQYPGAGTVQLAALGRWLASCGFALWDLGMELPYKLDLGGRSVPRAEWARRVRALREASARLVSPDGPAAEAARLITEPPEPPDAPAEPDGSPL